ncbi:MAG TPA: ATP-binding protein [Candidatus Thermoplasmatota archaeon]|nr:ATP-binding protein [Candidatus Thermoplasmatota archaeon]
MATQPPGPGSVRSPPGARDASPDERPGSRARPSLQRPPRPAAPAPPTPPPNIPPPAEPGQEPAAIDVPKAPGNDGSMEVVVAAEVLRRVNRTRQAVSLVSQVIIRSYEEEALHAEVCRYLVSFGGYLMAWIGLAEETPEKVVRPVAHAGLEPNFLQALKIAWSSDLDNHSPTSRAILEQRPHVARNILKEPRFAVLRKEAQLYGYTATCALPLQFAQYGMGVLTIHAMEPDAFNAEEVALLRELSNDLSTGVISLREKGRRQILEARLAAVIDAADDAIVGNDVHGAVTDWNKGAARMFGYTREEVLGRPIAEFLVPPDRLEEDTRVRAAVARGERVPRFETVRLRKDGRLVQASVTVSPIFASDGEVVGSTAVGQDVTAARVAEVAERARELEEAEVTRLKGLEKLRKTFLSEASHELNTPLTPLRLQVEALKEAKNLTPQQRDQLDLIDRNVLRLCNLVNGMLDASRLETGRYRLELADVALAGLVEETLGSLGAVAARAGVALAADAGAPLVVEADRNRVGQVLFNLVTNAIHFTPSGGRITVGVRTEGGQAVVRVADTGVGLSPEQMGKLFQPFSRPHEARPTTPKGTGLGLFISKGIIEQHGGGIWAESEGPGAGSVFCFSLPLATAPRERIQLFQETEGGPARRTLVAK